MSSVESFINRKPDAPEEASQSVFAGVPHPLESLAGLGDTTILTTGSTTVGPSGHKKIANFVTVNDDSPVLNGRKVTRYNDWLVLSSAIPTKPRDGSTPDIDAITEFVKLEASDGQELDAARERYAAAANRVRLGGLLGGLFRRHRAKKDYQDAFDREKRRRTIGTSRHEAEAIGNDLARDELWAMQRQRLTDWDAGRKYTLVGRRSPHDTLSRENLNHVWRRQKERAVVAHSNFKVMARHFGVRKPSVDGDYRYPRRNKAPFIKQDGGPAIKESLNELRGNLHKVKRAARVGSAVLLAVGASLGMGAAITGGVSLEGGAGGKGNGGQEQDGSKPALLANSASLSLASYSARLKMFCEIKASDMEDTSPGQVEQTSRDVSNPDEGFWARKDSKRGKYTVVASKSVNGLWTISEQAIKAETGQQPSLAAVDAVADDLEAQRLGSGKTAEVEFKEEVDVSIASINRAVGEYQNS